MIVAAFWVSSGRVGPAREELRRRRCVALVDEHMRSTGKDEGKSAARIVRCDRRVDSRACEQSLNDLSLIPSRIRAYRDQLTHS